MMSKMRGVGSMMLSYSGDGSKSGKSVLSIIAEVSIEGDVLTEVLVGMLLWAHL